jgi:hypothetical protein
MLRLTPILVSITLGWQPVDVDPPTTQPTARSGFRGRTGPTDRLRIVPPEQRDQAFKDRIVELAARNYQLDDLQKSLVRAEIDRLHAERVASMGAEALEYDALRKEMNELWVSLARDQAGLPRNRRAHLREMRQNERFREVNERLRVLDAKYPFNWNTAMERVESALPPEVVAQGRERREKRRNFRTVTRAPASQPAAAEPVKSGEATAEQEPTAATVSLHEWEIYTRQFVTDYALTTAQENAALSILKDVMDRAGQMEMAHPDRVDATHRELFDELRKRLDALLTAVQRAAGRR